MDFLRSAAEMRAWAREAEPSTWRAYFRGDLARERIGDPDLHERACLALAFDLAGIAAAVQARDPETDTMIYMSIRRAKPAARHPLIEGRVSGVQFLAARALLEQSVTDDRVSAVRLIARAWGFEEEAARAALEGLQRLRLVEPQRSCRGQPRPMLTRAGRDLCFA